MARIISTTPFREGLDFVQVLCSYTEIRDNSDEKALDRYHYNSYVAMYMHSHAVCTVYYLCYDSLEARPSFAEIDTLKNIVSMVSFKPFNIK